MIRGLLAARSVLRTQVRGKALENYARPSIDEIGVPTESWKQVHDKNQSKFNIQLLMGIVSSAAMITWFVSEIEFNSTPYHLMKNDK